MESRPAKSAMPCVVSNLSWCHHSLRVPLVFWKLSPFSSLKLPFRFFSHALSCGLYLALWPLCIFLLYSKSGSQEACTKKKKLKQKVSRKNKRQLLGVGNRHFVVSRLSLLCLPEPFWALLALQSDETETHRRTASSPGFTFKYWFMRLTYWLIHEADLPPRLNKKNWEYLLSILNTSSRHKTILLIWV